jgi:hypothetical protein
MPGSPSPDAGNFFVGCARAGRDPFGARVLDDAARERDDARVLDAIRPRYRRGAPALAGDTLASRD